MIHVPGMKALHEKFKADIQRYPEELKAPSEYFEWTIEERHRWHWRRHAKLQEINADLYFHNVDSSRGVDLPMFLAPGTDPTLLHTVVFSNAVQKLASDEQIGWWMKDIRALKMMGCYAQTELGHGSNVAELETTATFDSQTDEFVVHSPTLTSTKYWPGGMGLWASHALVMAKCIVNGKKYGVQAFMVPIRSNKDQSALPGIKVGDIGPKLGNQENDNGWLQLE